MIRFSVTPSDVALAQDRRRAHIREREAMQALRNAAQERDDARHFSAEAKAALRRERAIALVIQQMTGDSVPHVPAELSDAFRYEAMCVDHGIVA